MTDQPRHGRRNNPANLQFWTEALAFWSKHNNRIHKSIAMKNVNRARKALALKIRALEKKLNRPHRIIKQLGAVQYLGN